MRRRWKNLGKVLSNDLYNYNYVFEWILVKNDQILPQNGGNGKDEMKGGGKSPRGGYTRQGVGTSPPPSVGTYYVNIFNELCFRNLFMVSQRKYAQNHQQSPKTAFFWGGERRYLWLPNHYLVNFPASRNWNFTISWPYSMLKYVLGRNRCLFT